ncbi:hypothetical protein LTR95_003266 [Oleoguttula sp. CCFEE 5521]
MASTLNMAPPRHATTATKNSSLATFLANSANHPLPLNASKAYTLIPVLPPTPLEVFEDRQDRRRVVNNMRIHVWGTPHNRTKVDELPEVEMQLIDLRLPTFRYVGRSMRNREKARYFREKKGAEVVEIEVDDWELRVSERKRANAKAEVEIERRRVRHATASERDQAITTEVTPPMCKRSSTQQHQTRIRGATKAMRAWEARLIATAEAAADAEAAEAEDQAWSRGVHQETTEEMMEVVTDEVIEACAMMEVDGDDAWERGVYQETTDESPDADAEMGIEDIVMVAGEQGTPDNELDERHMTSIAREALKLA